VLACVLRRDRIWGGPFGVMEEAVSRVVQIAGDRADFPANACVNCLRPASHEIEIVKVVGSVVRKVNVPFCEQCIALRRSKSRRQVQFERVAVTNSALLALVAGGRTCYAIVEEQLPSGGYEWAWGLLLGVLVAAAVFGLLYTFILPWSMRFRSPETKAALKAVTIREFDWDTTTLEFGSEEYGDRFAQMNAAGETPGPPG
jgi:hypothetical protein